MDSNREIIFLLGPTASGKSDLAIEIAREKDFEIVNCDSQQVYQELNAGTAKPTEHQLTAAPHHLYSFVNAGTQYTAGQYRRDVLGFLEEQAHLGKNRFLFVGGSGFYVHALLTEMYPVGAADAAIREQVLKDFKESGPRAMFEELKLKDPVYAEKIGPNDHYRLQRALEILRAGFVSVSEFRKQAALRSQNTLVEKGYRVQKFALDIDREELRKRLSLRTAEMFKQGLVEETKMFLERGLHDWRPLMSVGYKEVRQFLDNELKFEELNERITISSMQLAKRQKTWLKRDLSLRWLLTPRSMLQILSA